MLNAKKFCFFITLALICIGALASAQQLRDGKIFDQGVVMAERAPTAPAALDKMAFVLGQWDVTFQSYQNDSLTYTATGLATISYMNRGHAFMERFHLADADGQGTPLSTMGFLTYSPSLKVWGLGEANSMTESISVLDGDFENGQLVLNTAIRVGGGMQLTFLRGTYAKRSDAEFDFTLNLSQDGGKSWQKQVKKIYRKRNQEPDLFEAASQFGTPAPDLPEQARQFDFLIGMYNATQEITFPNGQKARFPSTSTASYALDGHAILEYNWYDIDPNLPDAATTIIRIYNRAMRRWESLYLANRGNNLLYFGGKKEGEQIILHLFASNTGASPISKFVFHSVANDSYAWFAESSTDRGKSFTKTWTIDFQRKK